MTTRRGFFFSDYDNDVAQMNSLSLHLMCAYLNRKAYHQQHNVMLHKYDECNILVFRGTNDAKSLTYSFHLWESEHIHQGYKKYSEDCREQVKSMNVDYSKPLVVTGHSIGSIAAALIANDLDVKAEVVLFGSPKLATAKFRGVIDANQNLNIYNYINESDIIAAYPFVYYDHLADPIMLQNTRNYVNPLTYHSMKTYSHNMFRKKQDVEQKGKDNPFDNYLDIL